MYFHYDENLLDLKLKDGTKISPRMTMALGLIVSLTEKGKSLKLSNPALAKVLRTESRTARYITTELQNANLIINEGKDDWHKELVANMPEIERQLCQKSDIDDKPTMSKKRRNYVKNMTEHSQKNDPITKELNVTQVESTKNSNRGKNESPNPEQPTNIETEENPPAESLGDEFRLARLLLDEIRKRKPDFRKPDLKKWASHIDLMLRRDKRKPERIAEVIHWCQADNGNGDPKWRGWQNNILSTETLRKKFDALELRMQEQSPQKATVPLKRNAEGKTYRDIAMEQIRQ